MNIEITQKHIDEGQQGSGGDCAIARALKDGGATDVHVGPGYLRMDGNLFAHSGSGFVRVFDNHKSFAKPFTLTLSPIQITGLKLPQFAMVGADPVIGFNTLK